MSAWLAQFISFISSDTGNLTYRLVLAFSIAVALNQSLGIQSPADSARRRRTLLGLGLLLSLQLGLFVISGLTWQGLIDGRLILPPLDRLVSLLSLLIIIWMWCLPDPTAVGDTAALIPALAILFGAVASTLWWSEQPTQLNYNGVLWDSIASTFGVVMGLLGMLFLLVLRPPEFGYGAAMLGIEAAGFGLHLAMLPYGNDYPSALRLAQMVAYPMLGLLAQRLPIAGLSDLKYSEADTARQVGETPALAASGKEKIIPAYADPAIWQTLTRLVAETDPDRMVREVALTLTQAFGADVCALIISPDATGNFAVQFAYDRVHHRFIEGRTIQGSALPVISSAWRMGRNRRLSASAASPDLSTVAQTFGLEVVNSLLFQPVLTADGKPGAGVLLLSLDPAKDWDTGEQEFAGLLARLLVQFLQRSHEMTGLRNDLFQARRLTRQMQDQVQAASDERQKAQAQLAVMRENAERDAHQIARLTTIAAAHDAAKSTLIELSVENEQLKENARRAGVAFADREQARSGELRLALQEIALFQEALQDAEEKITALKTDQVDASPSDAQFETIASIGKDLRQPLASIGGYADVLLSESMGILGANQRKLLERIKVSTERMGHLLDELYQATAPESNTRRLEFSPLDVGEVVQSAIVAVEKLFARRRITIQSIQTGDAIQINSDVHALKKIVIELLKNAGLASPEGGVITARTRVESGENDLDYVLLQVEDQGGGIPHEQLTGVFMNKVSSPQESAGGAQNVDPVAIASAPVAPPSGKSEILTGMGASPVEMGRIKTLVEAIGGRIWVDSVLDSGATFSVLLPVIPTGLAFELSATERSENDGCKEAL